MGSSKCPKVVVLPLVYNMYWCCVRHAIQSPESIFLNVKFAHKFDTPSTLGAWRLCVHLHVCVLLDVQVAVASYRL